MRIIASVPLNGALNGETGPGFSTAHSCAGEKEPTSCRFPLRGLSSPTHRRTGGPQIRGRRELNANNCLRPLKRRLMQPLAVIEALDVADDGHPCRLSRGEGLAVDKLILQG